METAKQERNTPSREADAELGRRAHMLIWDAKLKQGEVAAMIGMGSDSLGRKLKGERGWALAEIIDLAAALDTSVAYLAGEEENPHPDKPNGGSNVGPAGIEPTTSTVDQQRLAPVASLDEARRRRVA